MMKRFLIVLSAILAGCTAAAEENVGGRMIEIQGRTGTVIYSLNDSAASDALWTQLPFEAEVSDFSTNEKIFYPNDGLPTENTPFAEGGSGVLAYYGPWGNVVMFYDSFSRNSSLYELGHAVSGEDAIHSLRGTIAVRKAQ